MFTNFSYLILSMDPLTVPSKVPFVPAAAWVPQRARGPRRHGAPSVERTIPGAAQEHHHGGMNMSPKPYRHTFTYIYKYKYMYIYIYYNVIFCVWMQDDAGSLRGDLYYGSGVLM